MIGSDWGVSVERSFVCQDEDGGSVAYNSSVLTSKSLGGRQKLWRKSDDSC